MTVKIFGLGKFEVLAGFIGLFFPKEVEKSLYVSAATNSASLLCKIVLLQALLKSAAPLIILSSLNLL